MKKIQLNRDSLRLYLKRYGRKRLKVLLQVAKHNPEFAQEVLAQVRASKDACAGAAE